MASVSLVLPLFLAAKKPILCATRTPIAVQVLATATMAFALLSLPSEEFCWLTGSKWLLLTQ
ncbi:hypothetical protein KXW59_003900 [Aspergillus fumigatus]|nr:hypothetical protein KXW59_003900 [Aspergillus fumigatus]